MALVRHWRVFGAQRLAHERVWVGVCTQVAREQHRALATRTLPYCGDINSEEGPRRETPRAQAGVAAAAGRAAGEGGSSL